MNKNLLGKLESVMSEMVNSHEFKALVYMNHDGTLSSMTPEKTQYFNKQVLPPILNGIVEFPLLLSLQCHYEDQTSVLSTSNINSVVELRAQLEYFFQIEISMIEKNDTAINLATHQKAIDLFNSGHDLVAYIEIADGIQYLPVSRNESELSIMLRAIENIRGQLFIMNASQALQALEDYNFQFCYYLKLQYMVALGILLLQPAVSLDTKHELYCERFFQLVTKHKMPTFKAV